MKTLELAVTRIGNSRGIRLPADLLRRHRIGDAVILEERADELVLRPKKQAKLSWKKTFAAMAAEKEDWSPWDAVAGDGVHDTQARPRPPRKVRRVISEMYGDG